MRLRRRLQRQFFLPAIVDPRGGYSLGVGQRPLLWAALYRAVLQAQSAGAGNSSFVDAGKVFSLSDLMPYEEFEETRFHKEWVAPQGLVDVLGANLDKSATSSAMLAILSEHAARTCR